MTAAPRKDEEDSGKRSSVPPAGGAVHNGMASRSYSRSLSHISENSADGVILTDRSTAESAEVSSLASGVSVNDIEAEPTERSPEPTQISVTTDTAASPKRVVVTEDNTQGDVSDCRRAVVEDKHCTEGVEESVDCDTLSQPRTLSQNTEDGAYVAHRVVVEAEDKPEPAAGSEHGEGEVSAVDSGVEEALAAVVSSLDDCRGQFPELHLLEQEVRLLQATLKVRRCLDWIWFGFTKVGVEFVPNNRFNMDSIM